MDDDERFLTKEEVDEFLLKIGVSEYRDKFTSNKMKLLQEIIISFQNNIPFTNIPLLSQIKEKRHVPSWDEMKHDCIGRYGGMCHTLNTFMYALLRSLGYEVLSALGTVTQTGQIPNVEENTHQLVIVRNLIKEGDMFLVDVGFGSPIFDAIPMDFEEEGEIFNHAYIYCKYVKENGMIIRKRLKVSQDPIQKDIKEGQWNVEYIFRLQPYSHSEASEFMKCVYEYSDGAYFHLNIKGIIFEGDKALGFKIESKDVVLRMIANPGDTKLTVTTESSINEIKNYIGDIIPHMPREMIDNAFKNFLN